jgi:hypothetical protein
MERYFVVGGEYTDTHFRETVGGNEEWYGPFETYEMAREEWAKHAWQSVDHCTIRYRIECIDTDDPPPCTD